VPHHRCSSLCIQPRYVGRRFENSRAHKKIKERGFKSVASHSMHRLGVEPQLAVTSILLGYYVGGCTVHHSAFSLYLLAWTGVSLSLRGCSSLGPRALTRVLHLTSVPTVSLQASEILNLVVNVRWQYQPTEQTERRSKRRSTVCAPAGSRTPAHRYIHPSIDKIIMSAGVPHTTGLSISCMDGCEPSFPVVLQTKRAYLTPTIQLARPTT
jgi:hypothetical protein